MKSNKGQYTNKCKSITSKHQLFLSLCSHNHISKSLSIVIDVSAATAMLLCTSFQKMDWNCKKFSLKISVLNTEQVIFQVNSVTYVKWCNAGTKLCYVNKLPKCYLCTNTEHKYRLKTLQYWNIAFYTIFFFHFKWQIVL